MRNYQYSYSCMYVVVPNIDREGSTHYSINRMTAIEMGIKLKEILKEDGLTHKNLSTYMFFDVAVIYLSLYNKLKFV